MPIIRTTGGLAKLDVSANVIARSGETAWRKTNLIRCMAMPCRWARGSARWCWVARLVRVPRGSSIWPSMSGWAGWLLKNIELSLYLPRRRHLENAARLKSQHCVRKFNCRPVLYVAPELAVVQSWYRVPDVSGALAMCRLPSKLRYTSDCLWCRYRPLCRRPIAHLRCK